MKTNYILLFVMALVGVYSSVTTIGHAPDVTLFKAMGYSFGINYSHNAILKLLCVALMIIATVIILQSKEDGNTKEQNI